jgi:hypothetical protein
MRALRGTAVESPVGDLQRQKSTRGWQWMAKGQIIMETDEQLEIRR